MGLGARVGALKGLTGREGRAYIAFATESGPPQEVFDFLPIDG